MTAGPRIVHEAEVVQPAVDALTRALIAALPTGWQRAQLVLSFGGIPPVITSLEGHRDRVAVSPAIGVVLAELDRTRQARQTGWTGAVLVVRREADASWAAAIDWHYGGQGTSATPAELLTALPATTASGPARHDALVARAEAELAGGQAVDALATLGEALIALPGDTFDRNEAGWIFVRMAGIRLGLGDAAGAARNARSALRCAGWSGDARALLRLGQAQQALGDAGAGESLRAAYHAGGDPWFAAVAPELLEWARAVAR